ncbi:S41 family peptidase [Sphingomonas psychrotolerans]|uniref:S41 family peptidase n=1 Tax=Sphingomonas psychrotolerans TaxID=1327635 RepID=A0ABU3N7A6_9SPHN|nr:S41 family peptidase [Sphingomonas psychrotolerans]MDT8759361.1 S41 family peptidase [Sphingomonas psychrotolerans]
MTTVLGGSMPVMAKSISATVPQAASTPPNETAPPNTLDAAVRRDIVAKLSEALRERYIFPEVGDRAAARINAALDAGEYSELADRTDFVQRLDADVRAIAKDKHLNVFSPIGAPPPRGPAMPVEEEGITRADRLAGGIGYIEVVGFPPPQASKPVVDRAMSALKGSRALIIDVRRNGGGSPEAVAYFVSYLVRQGQPLTAIVSRVPKTREFTRHDASSTPTPVSFAGIPVYVLTSKNTFSGGEDFAYTAQALKRATIVGEVTGGGANPAGPVDLGHGVIVTIPFGRSENPITKANWEGRGVQPDVAVAASDGLAVALKRAGARPVKEIEAASVKSVFAARTTPLPGYETAMRQLVAAYLSGQPDYSIMTPEFADETRRDLPRLHAGLMPLGELRSVKYTRSMMGGGEFLLRFAKGSRLMPIVLDEHGKIAAAAPPIPVP